MAIDRTTVKQYHDSSSSHIRKVGRYVGSAAYATGGDALAAGDLGLGSVDFLIFGPLSNGTVILLAAYDYAAGKVKVFNADGTEHAAGDLSTYSGRFEAIGL
jgi:hypothetical protein